MRVLGPSEVAAALDFPGLIEALRRMLRARDIVAPRQHCHTIKAPNGRDGVLLITPAWREGWHLGVELMTAFPDNASRDGTTLLGAYLLLDGRSGKPIALLDGPSLIARRIAATSALAATYLARSDCERLLMIGTGWLASHLIEAHASVRPIRHVLVWGRDSDEAARLAQRMTRRTLKVAATDDLPRAVAGAHVICCATGSTEPILRGHWLPLGAHLDLVVAFTPDADAADDETTRRASVFVDTREGVPDDPADTVGAIGAGAMTAAKIAGDLFELTRGSRAGRRFNDQITLFKSVGLAFLDLAAAKLAFDNAMN